MKIFKYFIFSFLFLVSIIALAIYMSPYRYNNSLGYSVIVTEIEIHQNPEEVFQYLGDSDNASNWSSYVNHIKPLNPLEFQDGQVGSKRRCFKEVHEMGVIWDEEILAVEKNKKRRLSIFNAKGFPMMADNLLTEQVYERLPKGNCRLRFSLFFDRNPGLISQVKMHLASYFIVPIFQKNLNNIKLLNEHARI